MPAPDRPRRRFAVVGTGSRAEMFVRAMATTHADVAVPVALVDPSPTRRAYYDELLAGHGLRAEHLGPEDLPALLDSGRVDAVVVASPDDTHADHVCAALDRGLDVVCEKPLAHDVEGLRRIGAAAERSAGELVVTFNYRYSPRNSAVRRLLADGAVGTVTGVHFEWLLDTVHGADYFRRWHREKDRSGGLLVHKATHHVDLVNWWLGDVPERVTALGGLRFYGDERAAERGLAGRPALSRDAGPGDPFALDLAADDRLRRLYLDAEGDDGYRRDQDVFAPGVTIEDTMSVLVGYRGGAALTYALSAYNPWEGYRVAVTGTEGRLELDVVERSHVPAGRTGALLGPGGKSGPAVDPSVARDEDADDPVRPFGARLVVQRQWERPRVVEIAEGAGAHGGGDALLLDDVLRGAGPDPLGRQAHYVDGVRSVAVGLCANRSMATGGTVRTADLGLPLDLPAGAR